MNGNGKRVLVVDDDVRAVLLVSTLLEQTGYNVLHVNHGPGALVELKKRRFDLVITDYSPMSSIDIIELLKHIHAHGLETPVVLVSSILPNISAVADGFQPFAWIRKPYEHSALLDLVSTAACVMPQSSKADASAAAGLR